MKVLLNTNAIKGLSHFVNVKDPRKFLKGVICHIKDGQVALIGANGSALGYYRDNPAEEEIAETYALIPCDVIKLLKGDYSELDIQSDSITLHSGQAIFEVKRCDIKDVPVFERLWPKTEGITGEAAYYSSELLNMFVKCRKAFKGKTSGMDIQIHFNGRGVAPIDIGIEGFYGLIMPYTLAEKPYKNPFE